MTDDGSDRALFLRVGETLIIGAAGGALFNWAGFPAGLISGSVLAVAGASLAGRQLVVPTLLTRVILVLAGITLGSVVTPEMVRRLIDYPASLAILAVGTLSMMGATTLYLRKVHHWDALSALFGASPGALSQVTALSLESGGDLRAIMIVQTVRVVILTTALPSGLALFGLAQSVARPGSSVFVAAPVEMALLVLVAAIVAAALYRLRFPGGWLFGAMLGSGFLHGIGYIKGGLPWWVASAAMVSLGAINGSRFAGTSLRVLLSYFGAAFGSFAVAIVVAACFMAAAASILPVPPADIVIAFAPGAQDTMMVLALALHLDPIFVGTRHFVRFLICSISVPLMARFHLRQLRSDRN